MNHADTTNIEHSIARSVNEALRDNDITITRVGYDGTGGVRFKQAPSIARIMEEATATDSATLDTSTDEYVWLVWGNDLDVIADYSEGLEDILAPVLDRIDFPKKQCYN